VSQEALAKFSSVVEIKSRLLPAMAQLGNKRRNAVDLRSFTAVFRQKKNELVGNLLLRISSARLVAESLKKSDRTGGSLNDSTVIG
jgi:hypothetical protein